MPDLYYLSDDAYEFLAEKAIEHNFVRPNAIRKSGISPFLCRLAYRVFHDKRPEELRMMDMQLVAQRKTPRWSNESIRRARLLDIDHEALTHYVKVAYAHRITMGREYKGGPHWRSATSITGAVLEAIGLGWLEPGNWPRQAGEPKSPLARAG